MRVEDRMLRSTDSDLLEGGVEMPTEYLLSYALAPERTLRRPLTVGLVDEHEGIGKKGSEGDCGLNRESADNERISADLGYEINKTDTCVSLRFFHPPFLLWSTTRRLTTRSQLARP
jgi:hypothetical protein